MDGLLRKNVVDEDLVRRFQGYGVSEVLGLRRERSQETLAVLPAHQKRNDDTTHQNKSGNANDELTFKALQIHGIPSARGQSPRAACEWNCTIRPSAQ